MDRTERFYKIEQLLRSRGVVPFAPFREKLEVSPATIKRDLEYLRSRLHAPIVWDRAAGGYRFDSARRGAPVELPGVWFNPSEIHALLTMRHLLSRLEPGIFSAHVEPLAARLKSLLSSADHTAEEIEKRVRILGMALRRYDLAHFEIAGTALLNRRRLYITYYTRSRDEVTEREISPQRFVHYRDNWYLDAWCHMRGGLRSFALDAIRAARILDRRARDVPGRTLDAVLGSGYGIFSGCRVAWARLRFTPERARWVAAEEWHPEQRGRFLRDGSYELKIPYSDDRELIGDILRHGADVEVIAPATLRDKVAAAHAGAAARYR
jgi:predicted DNA-binding transcriptional regulator YafY